MSPVHIKRRKTLKGEARYVVYFRRGGGREAKTEYAGSFHKRSEAQLRRDLIAGEIAAGRDPRVLLAELRNPAPPPEPPPGLLEQWDNFIDGAPDVAPKTLAKYRNSRDKWVAFLGADRDPQTITPALVQAGISWMLAGDEDVKPLSPATIAQYVSPLGQVLDFCDVEPNPVRSPKVKLPRQTRADIRPPATKEWFAARAQILPRSLLALRLIECCGLRISECVQLTYGDLDFVDRQIRVFKTKTKSGQRWLPVPDELLDEIEGLTHLEDRAVDRLVFGVRHDTVRSDLQHACLDAGVPHFSPHELRHRRVSLWYRMGLDPITVKGWAGHARPSMGLDVYGHVVLDPREDEWRDFWIGMYEQKARSRGASGGHWEPSDG